MTDPILASARYVVRESLQELRLAVQGLPLEALDWRPGGDETNSIAVLTTHVLHSTRWWLSVALGTPLPDRDRDSEFKVSAAEPTALLRLIDEMSADCAKLLGPAREADWGAMRRTGDPQEVPAAFALLHGIAHLREHVGQMMLTRQLWEARSGA